MSDTQTQTSQVFVEWEIGREAWRDFWRDFALDTKVIFNSISRSVVLMEFKLSVSCFKKVCQDGSNQQMGIFLSYYFHRSGEAHT